MTEQACAGARETVAAIAASVRERFRASVSVDGPGEGGDCRLLADSAALPELCRALFWESGCQFGGIVVEEEREHWTVSYPFLAAGSGWVTVVCRVPIEIRVLPSISPEVHAADWYEREAEDLFGLRFERHPRLGDFVLHDQVWQEHVEPMRKAFDAARVDFKRRPQQDWRPALVVEDPGAFAMPVGPVYEGGVGQAVHFLLETVGEDVIRALPRLFYKYRAVEKIAEGRVPADALLLAERFSATSAFAHGLAFCQAIEWIAGAEVPARARTLRVALAELERLRHHAGTIAGICQSTALSVSEAQASIVEERLLRACCAFAGHRYLFGLNTPGGLCRDFAPDACGDLLRAVGEAEREMRRLEERLKYTSSFLDRLEEVGVVSKERACDLDLLGPVGRASGGARDARRDLPYAAYGACDFEVAREEEGDGYARLRVLFFEAYQSIALIRRALGSLEPGSVRATAPPVPAGAAAGCVEAPIGAAVHWLRLDEAGRIARYRLMTPSFRNWLGLHVAVEDFAFQDFPIILATFGLSAAECDR